MLWTGSRYMRSVTIVELSMSKFITRDVFGCFVINVIVRGDENLDCAAWTPHNCQCLVELKRHLL